MVSHDKPETLGESTVSPPANNRWLLIAYLAPFVAVPILILVAAVLVIPTDWFADRSNNLFMDTLGYGAALHGADCKVAIYGDSTAILGVNPNLIRQYTGLSACNIAEVAGVNLVNGTMPLDQFLAQNPRPQFLVFMFAPEGFNPESQRHNPDITTFEGVTYRLRQPDKVAGFFALMRHPEDVFSWAEHGVRMSIDDLTIQPFPPDTKYTRFRTLGQTGFRNPPLTSCNYPHHNPAPDRGWVNGLRAKYGVDGTTVIFDATPLPECDPDLSFYRQQFKGLVDNSFTPLPLADYYAGGRHVYPTGAASISKEVSDQILERMKSNAKPNAKQGAQ